MCGIVGFTNYNKEIKNNKELIQSMVKKIIRRGENESNHIIFDNVSLGHSRLSIIDLNAGKQPMTFTNENDIYTICYNGEIYNYDEIRNILKDNNIKLESRSDTEMVLKLYMLFKEKCLNYLNGIFAFAIYEKNSDKIFLARDHIGVKPLFYTIYNNELFFSSEIKGILEYKQIPRILDKNGICQLFGISPARELGKAVFKDIYEIKPGNYAIFKDNKFEMFEYFKLKSYKHEDNLEDTLKNVKRLLADSIKRQTISDVSIGAFLSGGVDSSIITSVMNKNLKGTDKLKTFSVDYVDNDINFKNTDFTPTRDNKYIDIMKQENNLNHKYIVLDNTLLYENLYNAMCARDLPSMADIDSSLLLFCNNVKKDVTVALSGEFADEIFCGYPWFYKKELLNSNTLPWSNSLDLREKILKKDIRDNIKLKSYVENVYKEAINNVPLEDTSQEDIIMKINSYLTMNYFGVNLLNRTDRMSMFNSLEVRVPFADYKLVEYVYNIPWKIKNYLNKEKGILREAFKDYLPYEILNRKKSPYPKTFDKKYDRLVYDKLNKILDSKNRISELIDVEYIKGILNSNEELKTPWFGQLMKKPQLMAFLIQMEMWLNEYDIKLDI